MLAGVAPQDGRYDLDFSKIKMTFDRAKAGAAIAEACAAWTKIASDFYREAQPLKKGDPRVLSTLQNSYAGKFYPLAEKLHAAINQAGPSNNGELFIALMDGKRVK